MADTAKSDRVPTDWMPPEPAALPPIFVWPPKPVGFLKFMFGFPGYLWPWATIYFAISLATWFWLTPDPSVARELSMSWIWPILLRNALLVLAVTSVWHIPLYVRKTQGTRFKYNARWLARDNPNFLFRNQLFDNVFWTFCSAVPIWTAYEVLLLSLQARGWAPVVSWREQPIYCALLLVLIPAWHDAHFYLVHRLIHWPPLYRMVHSIHHRNVNPGPWSGLSMHPVEHLLYFSGTLLYWLVPATPLHVIFHVQWASLLPQQGHNGFGKIDVGGEGKSIDTDHYVHYLHHKYFEVNYGGHLVPFDKWFGTFHDGTMEAHGRMNERLRKRHKKSQ